MAISPAKATLAQRTGEAHAFVSTNTNPTFTFPHDLNDFSHVATSRRMSENETINGGLIILDFGAAHLDKIMGFRTIFDNTTQIDEMDTAMRKKTTWTFVDQYGHSWEVVFRADGFRATPIKRSTIWNVELNFRVLARLT